MLKNVSASFLLFLLTSVCVSGQPAPVKSQPKVALKNTTLAKKLDSIFYSFNKSTPGIAVTVLKDGKILARKAYGMASLEYAVPFTHNTIVRIPYSESREFISIAAVMMEQEGLLNFNDKVRKYFPKLPGWSEPVTIQDLLNHSSGFDDEWAVLLLTQASMGNRFDVSQFLNLLYNQPAPGIEPGKGYMYCNSDFGLLRLILEKASGENLAAWMKRKIFEPLDMPLTRLHDNKNEVIPGFAHEYEVGGRGKYERWTNDKTSPGGNYFIATAATDLEKWAMAHADPRSFVSKAIRRLKKEAVLMPGKGKNYVFGIKEHAEDGYPLIAHQGVSDRPYLSSSPSNEYAVIVLGNSGTGYVQFHRDIMNGLLGIKKAAFLNKKFTTAPTTYTAAALQQLAGRYFDVDTLGYESYTKDRKNLFQLVVHNDSLKWQLDKDNLVPLVQVAPNVFKDLDYEAYMEFVLPKEKKELVKIYTHVYPQNKVYEHIKDTTVVWTPSREALATFIGKYYSPHLDFYWTLLVNEEGRLIIRRPTIADTELIPESRDLFTLLIEKYANSPGFEVFVQFHRDVNEKITHFTVSDARLMFHRFEKQP